MLKEEPVILNGLERILISLETPLSEFTKAEFIFIVETLHGNPSPKTPYYLDYFSITFNQERADIIKTQIRKLRCNLYLSSQPENLVTILENIPNDYFLNEANALGGPNDAEFRLQLEKITAIFLPYKLDSSTSPSKETAILSSTEGAHSKFEVPLSKLTKAEFIFIVETLQGNPNPTIPFYLDKSSSSFNRERADIVKTQIQKFQRHPKIIQFAQALKYLETILADTPSAYYLREADALDECQVFNIRSLQNELRHRANLTQSSMLHEAADMLNPNK